MTLKCVRFRSLRRLAFTNNGFARHRCCIRHWFIQSLTNMVSPSGHTNEFSFTYSPPVFPFYVYYTVFICVCQQKKDHLSTKGGKILKWSFDNKSQVWFMGETCEKHRHVVAVVSAYVLTHNNSYRHSSITTRVYDVRYTTYGFYMQPPTGVEPVPPIWGSTN